MIYYFICILAGAFAASIAWLIITRERPVGELQVDAEKEILQVVYFSPKHLDETIRKKRFATFLVVHKKLEWATQEKQSL